MPEDSILILAPHHDDESIGCGGTARILANQGKEVNLAVVTAGYSGIQKVSENEAMRIRERETLNACDVLGIRQTTFMRLRDHALVFNEENLHALIEIMRRFNPSTIYLPHSAEGDRDHRIVNELGREAAWLAQIPAVLPQIETVRHKIKLLCYEIWTTLMTPHVTTVIDTVWDAKQRAIEQHISQMAQANYVQMARGLNAYRAVQQCTGAAFAECFSHP